MQREQQRSIEGLGKGKGARMEGRAEAGYVPRTPQRMTGERAEASSRQEPTSNTPLFSEDRLRRFHDIYQNQKAPLIYPDEREAVRRQEMREAEERSYRQVAENRKWLEERRRMEDIHRPSEEARRKDEELSRLRERTAALEMENAVLKMREGTEWGRSSQFATRSSEDRGGRWE